MDKVDLEVQQYRIRQKQKLVLLILQQIYRFISQEGLSRFFLGDADASGLLGKFDFKNVGAENTTLQKILIQELLKTLKYSLVKNKKNLMG